MLKASILLFLCLSLLLTLLPVFSSFENLLRRRKSTNLIYPRDHFLRHRKSTIVHYTRDRNLGGGRILVCDANCNTCSGTATACTSCTSSTYLYYADQKCYSKCPSNYYGDVWTDTCKVCPIACSQCSRIDICHSCFPSYFLEKLYPAAILSPYAKVKNKIK